MKKKEVKKGMPYDEKSNYQIENNVVYQGCWFRNMEFTYFSESAFDNCTFINCTFKRHIKENSFFQCDFKRCTFDKLLLSDCIITECTCVFECKFIKTDFRNCKFIEFWIGDSIIDKVKITRSSISGGHFSKLQLINPSEFLINHTYIEEVEGLMMVSLTNYSCYIYNRELISIGCSGFKSYEMWTKEGKSVDKLSKTYSYPKEEVKLLKRVLKKILKNEKRRYRIFSK